jgi:hypothetical protein
MPFPLSDVRITTRRPTGADDEALPLLYPRLLRDAAFLPKIAIAISYFESMVGKERREFDPELLVQFFGDHKLARSIVASLARRYRYRTPPLEEVIKPGALLRLRRAGLDRPRLLRLELYDRANAEGPGFLATGRHADLHGKLERRFRLRRGDLDRLLHLDADEHAILTRVGPGADGSTGVGSAPEPKEVMAFYNFDALDTLLRRAEQVDLAVAGLTEDDRADLHARAAAEGVTVELKTGMRATLTRYRGRQDSMGLWSRHGRRVSRAVTALVRAHRPGVLDAAALIALKHKRALLNLTPELLEMLAFEDAAPDAVAVPSTATVPAVSSPSAAP